MKKLIAFIMILAMITTTCFAQEALPDQADDFGGLNDPSLLPYMEDQIYQALVENLDSDEYFVENVSAIYISDEYLEELAFNSQSNVYFGYTIEELEQQFQGQKYVFTLSDTYETTVEKWEPYDDTMEKVIRNVAIGSGVILVCVTVSVVTGGVGATAVSMVFACAAKTGTICALSGGAIGGAASGIFEYIQTGDPDKALKAAALGGSEAFKWGAITGAISGGASEYMGLRGVAMKGDLTMNQAATIQKNTKWPLEAIKNLHSVEESEVYLKAGLTPIHLEDGKWIFAKKINWDLTDDLGRSNVVRVRDYKLAPIDDTGMSYEVHHLGQQADGPLAMLTHGEHHNPATYSFIHYAPEGKNITEAAWAVQRSDFWRTILRLQKGI